MSKSKKKPAPRGERREKISAEIARRIGTPACVIFVIVAVIIGVLITMQVYTSKQTELTLESEAAGNDLNAFFQPYLRSVEQLSVDPEVISSIDESDGKKTTITKAEHFSSVLENMQAMQASDPDNVMAVWICDIEDNVLTQSDGFTSDSSFDCKTRDWYAAVSNKAAMLTKPYVDASTGQTIVSAAAPIVDPATGDVRGVAGLDLSLAHVGEILSQSVIGSTGYVIMTAADGTIIYHPDDSLIQQNMADLDISSKVVDAIAAGEKTFFYYKINGSGKYGYLMPVGDTGYLVISSMTSGEYMRNLFLIIAGMIVIFAIGVVFIFLAIRKVASSLTKPIEELNAAAQELAAGNLNVELEVTSKNEIGELGRSIQQTVERLKMYIAYIDEVSAVLAQMSDGKLAIHLKQDYAGDFRKIKDALIEISGSMTEVLSGITESSGQVSGGADDLASAAQTLAEGATTQAAAVEELVATAESIVIQLQNNKEEAMQSAAETKKVTQLAENSKQQMGDMLTAMQTISDTSNQVVSIIHTIEEIADQTNLLSLNASIEAARAGEAGKSFAVVASEIGSLANESAQAASSTKEMIEISMNEIEKGVKLANDVTESLQEVVAGIEQVNHMIDRTAELAVEQEDNMKQMQSGIDSISHAVQDTSATAEESSATSEELAAQATVLTDMIRKFDLSDTETES